MRVRMCMHMCTCVCMSGYIYLYECTCVCVYASNILNLQVYMHTYHMSVGSRRMGVISPLLYMLMYNHARTHALQIRPAQMKHRAKLYE